MGKQVVYMSLTGDNLNIGCPEHKGRNNKGDVMALRNLKFKEGFLKYDTEKDAESIEILETHIGNVVNGGNSFRKQSDEVTAVLEVSQGKVFAMKPDDGLKKEDIETLKYLAKVSPSMLPNTVKKVNGMVTEVYERYKFAGLPKPDGTLGAKRLYARLVEMMETLAERGIWDDDIEGEGHSGQGSQEGKE